MENNQLLPFERNRYYVGKLLTSADFQAEQTYGNHKRRFLNEMMFGSGIVCGLGVYSLDDLSIMVDSGVAVDGLGREIALENPVVRKLSAVDGFENLTTGRAALCLHYDEENVHPVYTVRGQESGETYECNRIREGWKLFLRDIDDVSADFMPEPEFLVTATLYADEDYVVTCTMPAQSSCGATVRLAVKVCRLNEAAKPLTLKVGIQIPAFTDENGSHVLDLELLDICPDGEVTMYRILRAQSMPAPESVLLADKQTIQVTVGGETRKAQEDFALHTTVVDATTSQILDHAAASANLEMRAAEYAQDFVVLAQIDLQRTRNAYLIEKVHTMGVRRYIRTAATAPLRQELEEWFQPVSTASVMTLAGQSDEAASVRPAAVNPIYATGTCEIPLGASMRRGQVAYSNEIVHGLGTGTVYVSVGSEYLADDLKLGTTARSTIYGNVELFPEEQAPIVAAETAVKVMNDRGSFVVAARLLEDSSQVMLPLRWVAVAMPSGGEESKLKKMDGKSIAAVQPTVVVATRDVHYVNVRFNNLEPCTLVYELTEKDSGTITSDGVYTAPGREGVFEIRISCAEMPLISTYAYVVVKKREALEASEQA